MKKGCPHSGGSPFVLDHKKRANHKPDSVPTLTEQVLIIYLG